MFYWLERIPAGRSDFRITLILNKAVQVLAMRIFTSFLVEFISLPRSVTDVRHCWLMAINSVFIGIGIESKIVGSTFQMM